MNALEEFYRFCYEHGGTLKAHKGFAYLHLNVAAELAELREELKEARRIIEYYAKDDPEPAESWLREEEMSAFDIVAVLKQQAEEITSKGIKGWGNTMLYAAEELAKLRAELKKTLEYGDEWQRACQERMREIEQLRAELATRKTVVMTESEYKDYLSEQDRLKREAEEENQ